MQQFTRRVIEEVSVSASQDVLGVTCFDIVRAYARVCRVALWQLLSRLGVPGSFLGVLKALHVSIVNGLRVSGVRVQGLGFSV